MTIKTKLITLKDKILEMIFPSKIKCILCGKDIPDFTKFFCDSCLEDDIFNNGNRCQKCDTKIKEGNIICDHCKEHKRHFDSCHCPLNYKNMVRQALLKFKSDNARYLAEPFAKLIHQRLIEDNVDYDIIVPVPSHEKTIKKRGYNPAKLLADELGKISSKPVADILCKNVITKNQKILNYQERQENLQNSIILTDKKQIKNKNVLIVDDIITTSATIEVCASLFVGARNVYACAVARNQL